MDGHCSAQAEQRIKPVVVGPLPGAYLSTETKLVPIRGVMRKEFETGHTRTHTHTHTHTRTHTHIFSRTNESAVDCQVFGFSAKTVTASKNKSGLQYS